MPNKPMRALVCCGVAVALVATILAAPSAAVATTGSVSGTVSSAYTGKPLAGKTVRLWQWMPDFTSYSFQVVATTKTSSTGHYAFSSVTFPRQTKVEAVDSAGVYRSEFYGGQLNVDDATILTASTSTGNIVMDRVGARGAIEGSCVSKWTGAPLAGVTVALQNPARGVDVTTTVSNADGTYRIVAEAGQYVLAFHGTDIASIYYPDIPYDPAGFSYLLAKQVTISDGKTTSGIIGRLEKSGSVTVQVAETPAHPGYSAMVTIYWIDPASGQPVQPIGGSDFAVGPWHGGYLAPEFKHLTPGVYIAKLTGAGNGWANGYLGGSPFSSQATTFTVGEGEHVTVQFAYQPGGTVSGGIVPAPFSYYYGNGQYLSGYQVVAMALNPVTARWEMIAYTNSTDGPAYSLTGLPNVPVRVGVLASHDSWGQPGGWGLFGHTPYVDEATSITWVDPVNPSAGATAGVDISLSTGLPTSGGFNPIEGAVSSNDALGYDYQVQLYGKNGAGAWVPVGVPAWFTGKSYAIDVPDGQYKIGYFMYGAEPVFNGNAFSLATAPVITLPSATGPNVQNVQLLKGYRCDFTIGDSVVDALTAVPLAMKVQNSVGVPSEGVAFQLQSSTDGKTWRNVKALTGGANGVVKTSVRTSAPTTYYRLYNSKTYYTVRKAIRVTRRATLSVPSVPTSARANRAFNMTGFVAPRHAAGTPAVRVYCYRLESGTWKLRKTLYAKCSARDSLTSRYLASGSLTAGSWRIRAYHSADSLHVSTWSHYRYFKLR
jgi:hypothetical protein